jgi:hypothetical protein
MAGYSATPLLKKLGIKPEAHCVVFNEPKEYWNWLSPLPEGVKVISKGNADFVHLFATDQKTFEKQFLTHKKRLNKNGMMWISWPKKSSKVPTDLDENIIRNFGLKNGLVDVKVCAVDEVWSGLKFVYRLQDR